MCICIFKPKDILLPKRVLKKSFNNNPDGAGFAYPAKDKKSIVVDRGYFGFREFWRAYRNIQKDNPVLIHFRIATSGRVDKENCHPFLIDKKHALIHNGNLEDKLEKIENVSDTSIFVDKKLKPLFADSKLKKKRFWASAPFKWLMEETIGSSKIAILDATGFETIYNSHLGEWEHGAWFSNDTFKKDRKSIRTAKVTKELSADGQLIKEITKFASGRSRTVYSKATPEDKSKAFILQDTPSKATQNKHITKAQKFMSEMSERPTMDISEMY